MGTVRRCRKPINHEFSNGTELYPKLGNLSQAHALQSSI